MGVHMKSLLSAAAFIALVGGATGASAQATSPTGFYVGAGAGLSKLNSVHVTYYDVGGTFGGTGTEDTLDARFRFKDAFTINGLVGYDFGMLRSDLEVSYARNKLRSLTIDSVNGVPIVLTPADRDDACDYLEATCGGSGNTFTIDGSRARQLNAMGNLWLDVPIGGTITPYIGGGVGIAGFEVDGEGKTKFAWQLGAGLAFNISPNVAITADYRHRQTGKVTITDGASGLRIGSLKTDSLTAGLRLYFGGHAAAVPEYVPAAAPPPPPATQTCADGTVIDASAACPMAAPPPPPPPAPTERGQRG